MRSLTALIHREFLEHRGAFLYAPMVLTVLFVIGTLMPFVSGHFHSFGGMRGGTASRFYEISYMFAIGAWWLYLLVTLFFYFADAFAADKRNNSMLFWKSMPQSDFKILLSKLAAGVTIFPGLVFCIALLSGLLLVVAALALPLVVPTLAMPDVSTLLASWGGLSVVFFCYLVIVLLWYVPFFAWVGALSTLVGRWAIPLALLIPVGISLFEGVIDFQTAPGGSYVLSFLRARTDMRYDSEPILAALLASGPVDVGHTLQRLVAYVDWPQTIGGVAFAVIVGVPLGVHLSREKFLAPPVLAFVSTLQTIPSVALLGFLIPLFGIGTKPAVLALSLYALLPIVRNTLTGIEQVDPNAIEAARGMGMRDREILATALPQYSKIATVCVLVVPVTGLVNGLVELYDTPGVVWYLALFTTGYGQIMLLKGVCLVIAALLGAHIRFRLLPAIRRRARTAVLRWASLELTVMAVAFGLAAVLVRAPVITGT